MKAWNGDKFTHHGEFWDFEDIEVLPKPLQDPMPVWMAAASDDAIAWAAEQGFSIMMSPHASYTDISEKKVLYRQTLESAGHAFGQRDIPVARTIALAETQEQAEAIGRKGAEFMLGAYLRNTSHIRTKPGDATGKTQPNEAVLAAEAANMDPVDRYIQQVAICGTPEKAIDVIEELRENRPAGLPDDRAAQPQFLHAVYRKSPAQISLGGYHAGGLPFIEGSAASMRPITSGARIDVARTTTTMPENSSAGTAQSPSRRPSLITTMAISARGTMLTPIRRAPFQPMMRRAGNAAPMTLPATPATSSTAPIHSPYCNAPGSRLSPILMKKKGVNRS